MHVPSRFFIFGGLALSLLAQLWLCQFFSLGGAVPLSIDINPSNLWKYAYVFPPRSSFLVLNWLGTANFAPSLTPFTLAAALLPKWLFFTAYMPIIATLAALTMVLFLQELGLGRAAALFGGLIYAWQGDILPFIFPGHFAYAALWPLLALAAWSVLCLQRTGHWAYALASGLGCGQMVEMLPDRGGIASLFIAALYMSQIYLPGSRVIFRHFLLCAGVALLIALAALVQLFQGAINGVHLAQVENREQAFAFCTQFSLGPAETLTFLIPGYFGWTSGSAFGPYWGSIGESISWAYHHTGSRNLNLAISTIGTIPSLLALLGLGLLLPAKIARWFGPSLATERQRFYFRWLIGLGLLALVLAWGYHTPLYRAIFHLPLMDKWRDPLKWLEVSSFVLVTLSAFGAEHLFSTVATIPAPDTVSRRQRLSRYLIGTVLGLLGLWLLSFPQRLYLQAYLGSQGYEPATIVQILSVFHFSLFLALVEAVLLLCVVRLLWNADELRAIQPINPLVRRFWQTALAGKNLTATLTLCLSLLSILQLVWVDEQFIHRYAYADLTSTNPLLDALAAEGNLVRVSVAVQDPILNAYLQNQFNARNISCLDISAASRIPDDLQIFQNTLRDEQARYFFLAGVKNLALPEEMVAQIKNDAELAANVSGADGFTLIATGSPDLPSHALVHLTHYLNKAVLVPAVEFLPNEAALLQRLHDPAWSPVASLLLLKKDQSLLPHFATMPAASGAPDEVDLKTYTPQEITLETKSGKGGYLLINDHYDPDWTVEVDGRPVPLLRADFIFRGIAVPPGVAQITLRYAAVYHFLSFRVPDLVLNLFCDGTMLAGWGLVIVALVWKEKRGDPIANNPAHPVPAKASGPIHSTKPTAAGPAGKVKKPRTSRRIGPARN